VGAQWSDAWLLGAVARPLVLVTAVIAALRVALDRLPLAPGTEAFAATFVGGALTVVVVAVYLLASDWPEAGVLKRRLAVVRGRPGTP
jgi:uncharacterized membrane protein YhaH (DUF805 family)